jgi:hypothetical protein
MKSPTMTKSDAQILTELLGGCWHEEIDITHLGTNRTCSCGFVGTAKELNYHIKESNPKYLHADEVLVPLREKLGEERYREFIVVKLHNLERQYWYLVGSSHLSNLKKNTPEFFILNVPALVKKAIEFLEQMKEE